MTDDRAGLTREERCCTGINGSHTIRCESEEAHADLIRCAQCGAENPASWAAEWGDYGMRCLVHEGGPEPRAAAEKAGG